MASELKSSGHSHLLSVMLIQNAFDDVNYGQLIKDFQEPVQPRRYGPPVMIA